MAVLGESDAGYQSSFSVAPENKTTFLVGEYTVTFTAEGSYVGGPIEVTR